MDPGNPHLGDYQTSVALTPVTTPGGPRLALTIRSGPATLTVMLNRESADQLGGQLTQAAGLVSPLVVAPAGVALPPLPSQNGHRS
jgi:hypothetical protein